MKVNMNDKAGNDGDKIKHSLLLTVLNSCSKWLELHYAETHAGAGVYYANEQNTSHIRDLEEKVESCDDYYHSFLKNRWWAFEKNKGSYPGSIILATRFLYKRSNVSIRFTEANNDTFNKLGRVISLSVDTEGILDSFFNQLDWLTEQDNLILLVDPFTYRSEDEICNLDQGDINFSVIKSILDKVWLKNGAVVLLWNYFPHGLEQAVKTSQNLEELATNNSAISRTFCQKHYYVTAIGIGQGKQIVENIPSSSCYYSCLSTNNSK